jgi:copper transport protein
VTALIAGERTPHRSHAIVRGLLAIALGCLLALLGAQSASAHAQLLSTTPEDGAVLEEAPAEAVLRFNETVQLLDGSIRLFPGDENPLTLDAHVVDTDVIAPLPDGLGDGRYALSYRVVSADGHPISGAITFTIGEATGTAPAPQIATETPEPTRFALGALTVLQYLGLLIFAGLVFFDRTVLRCRQPVAGRARAFLLAAGIVAASASVLLIPISALDVTGEALWSIATPTAWWSGVLWPPVAVAVAALAGTGVAYLTSSRGGEHLRTRAASVVAALVALCGPVLVGHSQLVEPHALAIGADIGHLLAGSFWTGGVVGLLLFLAAARPADRGATTGTDPLLAAEVVRRFSRYALWSVLLLALSGTIMGVMIVGTFDTLFTTGYGLTLMLKLGVIAPIVGIAAYNRRRLLPAIVARPTTRLKWRILHRTLAYEAALLIAVLVVTGFLTNQSPNHDHHHDASEAATAETITIEGSAQELDVDGSLSPALSGDNAFTFTLKYQNQPSTPETVVVRASLPDHDLGPFQVTPQLDPATGEYTATLSLPVAGQWQLQVLARVSTFAEPIVTIPVAVR